MPSPGHTRFVAGSSLDLPSNLPAPLGRLRTVLSDESSREARSKARGAFVPPWRREVVDDSPSVRSAAVLILLYGSSGEFRFPLIVRTPAPGPHGGQIALPGGSREAGESAEETALREAREEIGVAPPSVQLLGRLSRLRVGVSRFCVRPVVGWTAERPDYVLQASEVAGIVEPSVSELLAPGTRGNSVVFRPDTDEYVDVPCFRLGGAVVWGATAMMLAEFSEALREAGIG